MGKEENSEQREVEKRNESKKREEYRFRCINVNFRGRNRQQDRDSPPLSTTPHYSNNTTANTKKKEKVGKEGNPDVFSIDLMTPMTELQIAYFGEPLNATFPSASCNETCETTKPTRTSTPHAQNRKGAVRTRTSLPDRLQKSLPPIHSSSNSGESGEDSENTGYIPLPFPLALPPLPLLPLSSLSSLFSLLLSLSSPSPSSQN